MKTVGPRSVSTLHNAGAVTVLAHPKYLGITDPTALRSQLAGFKEIGLDGIEVFYSQHTEAETALYQQLAHDLGFAISGGSDFHGASKPAVKLGVVYQGRGVPDSVLAELKALTVPSASPTRL